MLLFRRLKVKDIEPYKSAEFNFTPGLHVVYGLNKTTAASNNGNAAGKSRFFSMVPETIFDEPVLGTLQDRETTGERELELEIGGDPYTFVRKGGKLSVLDANGKPVGRTTKETKQWLSKHLPLSEEDVASYVYLDSLRHHPLVRGTTAERKRFLDSFFDLEKIGAERKKIMSRLSDLRPIRAAHAELTKERAAVADLLAKKLPLSELKTKVEKSRVKLERLQAENDKNMEIRRVVEYVKDNQKPIAELIKALQDRPLNEDTFKEALDTARATLRENLVNLQYAREYSEYQDRTRAYTEAAEALTPEARRILERGKKGVAAKHYARYVELEGALSQLEAAIPDKPEKPVEPEAPSGNEDDLVMLRSMIKSKLEHAKKFGTGACPTCGQTVKVQSPEKLAKRLKRIDRDLQAHADYTVYLKELATYSKVKVKRRDLRSKYAELEAELEKYRRGYKVHKILRNMPEQPDPYKGKKYEARVFERMVEEDRHRIRCLEILESGIHLLVQYQDLKNKEYSDSSTEMTALAERHAVLTSDLEVVRTYRKRLKRMDSELEAMSSDLESERFLKLLLEAYADKGMKKMAVQAISHSLMAQVNKYASRIFPENYRFELIWEKSQISIRVFRRYGMKIKSSDVRKLSGAESRLFTYVMVLSLMTFVPDNRRSSVMILDEPSTNMSQETRDSFKELLTIMNQVIPTIIVLTPNSDEVYDGAVAYTAVKRNGVATLVNGHPTQIK